MFDGTVDGIVASGIDILTEARPSAKSICINSADMLHPLEIPASEAAGLSAVLDSSDGKCGCTGDANSGVK